MELRSKTGRVCAGCGLFGENADCDLKAKGLTEFDSVHDPVETVRRTEMRPVGTAAG